MRLLIVIAAVVAVSGCVSQPASHSKASAASGDTVALVAPRLVGGNHSATQVVHGAFGAREISINCIVTISGDQLTIVGLTAMGVRVFTIHYDGQSLQIDHDLPAPPQLTPERLLADVQLVFWPLEALRNNYRQAGMELTQPFAGTRRVRHNDRVTTEVHYASDDPWNGRNWLVNLEYGYTLNIDSKPLDVPAAH